MQLEENRCHRFLVRSGEFSAAGWLRMTAPAPYVMGRELAPEERLLSARAAEVLRALHENPDFELESVRRLDSGKVRVDLFYALCTSEGVPERNSVGIRYREPLGILVAPEANALPEVFSLRSDFPATGHQNNAPVGLPTTLCLYTQRPRAVLRTWTAAAYLRRIQWWLTETAHGRLHQVDQPVEQLFFDSPDEVILPAGYLSAGTQATALAVAAVCSRRSKPDRKAESCTLFLEPASADINGDQSIHFIDLVLPPVTHGVIEREPTTLGALEDQLNARGTGVLEQLNAHIRTYVGQGRVAEDRYRATLLLLRVPIRRTAQGPIEAIQARAFSMDANLLAIGEKTGAVFRGENEKPPRYFVYHALSSAPPSTAWCEEPIFPLSVHERTNREAARRMSGVSDPGPRAVLAGAGSLGSALIDLWRRCGWGSWDVIDPDHLLPHNVIRHVADQLGWPKAEALAKRDRRIWREPEAHLRPLVADASAVEDATVLHTLTQAELLVDGSTVLEVPRKWAVTDALKRVVSCFLNPAGSDAVLLAEDRARRHRVDALEAQYLRAVLIEPWGMEHLAAKTARFRSGTSCRDFSFVMPYSAVLPHAATLAEHIQSLTDTGLIRVWQRDRTTGAVAVHDVPLSPAIMTERGGFTVVWDEATLQKVKDLRAQALPHETGGVLIGYHDLSEQRIYIVDALAAPTDSIGTPEGFERGVKGLADHFAEIRRRTAGQVGYLGEWHSHPKGIPARPSEDDIGQLLYLGELLQRENLPALQFIVAENEHAWLLCR
jgi:integrative and conjugative element protein (TIGR02256 family)